MADIDFCPGCGEGYAYYMSGSNLHWYKRFMCPNYHEWVLPFSSEEIEEWMKVNNAHSD